MKSTYNIITGFFTGNYPINELPIGRAFADFNYNLQFINGKWDGSEWIEGATPEEILEANKPIVPISISQMKLRMQLVISGISIASIYTAIDSIPDQVQRELTYAKWEYAVVFDRQDATLNQMAQMLGISQIELDQIFIEGNNL